MGLFNNSNYQNGTEIDDRNRLKHWVYWLWAAIALLFFVLFASWEVNTKLESSLYNVKVILMELTLAAASSFFILAFIDFYKGKSEDKARKDEIKDIILDTLMMDKGIISKFDTHTVDKIMGNSIAYYCTHLSEHYKNYIKNHFNIFRKDFFYSVRIDANTEDNKAIYIAHDLRYERYFKVEQIRADYQFKCYFAIQKGGLDEVMNDSSIFFREELLYQPLISKINKIKNDVTLSEDDKKIQLLKLLDISFSLRNNNGRVFVVANDMISMNLSDRGILFTTKIDSSFVSEYPTTNGDAFICYTGKITCRYPSKLDNQFYCIFPNPTVGNTEFNISFDRSIMDVETDVNYITMLSLEDDGYEIEKINSSNGLSFSTQKAIFPRSGLLVQWETNTPNC